MKSIIPFILLFGSHAFALDVVQGPTSAAFADTFVNIAGDTMTGPLTTSSLTVTGNGSIGGSSFSVGTSTFVVTEGKIGVGTASPFAALTVNGSISAQSIALASAAWSTSYNSPESYIYSLAAYNGKLYAGTASSGIVYVFDGTTWSTSYDSPESYIRSLAAYNGKLYAGTYPNGIVYSVGDNYDVVRESLVAIPLQNQNNFWTEPQSFKSTVTVTGISVSSATIGGLSMVFRGAASKANILLVDPVAAGEFFYCTDCTAEAMCVSTGTAVGAWTKFTDKTAVCD